MGQVSNPPDNDPAPRTTIVGSRSPRLVPYAVGAAAAMVGFLALTALLPREPQLTRQQVDEAIASSLASVTPPPAYSRRIYDAVQPSLVHVQVERAGIDAIDDRSRGFGSGVVVSLAGDILTSLHVVDGADDIRLTFADGTGSTAEIVGTDPDKDIAVLRAVDPPATLAPATLGNPATVRPGNEAFAMGSPFGLYGSVTSGVISGLDRTFTDKETGRRIEGLFQIDAAVNPGNSGGALVDRNGLVVGIVTALINPTRDEVFIGIGLAVPIDAAGGAAGLPPY